MCSRFVETSNTSCKSFDKFDIVCCIVSVNRWTTDLSHEIHMKHTHVRCRRPFYRANISCGYILITILSLTTHPLPPIWMFTAFAGFSVNLNYTVYCAEWYSVSVVIRLKCSPSIAHFKIMVYSVRYFPILNWGWERENNNLSWEIQQNCI